MSQRVRCKLSDVLLIGGGLSGPAIAGIAAGIPCSLLVLGLLLGGTSYLWFYCNNKKSVCTMSLFNTKSKILDWLWKRLKHLLCLYSIYVVGQRSRYPMSRMVEKVRVAPLLNMINTPCIHLVVLLSIQTMTTTDKTPNKLQQVGYSSLKGWMDGCFYLQYAFFIRLLLRYLRLFPPLSLHRQLEWLQLFKI